ncbi:MAG: FapA family protein [Peptococcaceae bacterium]|nr:FapA family protein [Peptococcaceae bacterium]
MQSSKKPSVIKISISRDKLTASIHVRGNPDYINIEDIYRELDEAGVKFGLKEHDINVFAASPSKTNVVIAEGVPPVPGKDGYMEILYDKKQSDSVCTEYDTVDYRETSTIISVEAGDQLVEVHPPVPGMEGIAVTGEAIEPPKPKEIKLQAGRGVVLNSEGNQAFAKVNGRPWIKEAGLTRIINCEPVYVHNGDVDIKTGNLRFKGDVKITGNICEAMEVQVSGNVEVQGLVTMARIISGEKIIVFGNVISSKLRAGVLFPGAKKLGFMISDVQTELQSLAQALEQLNSKKIIDFQVVEFSRVVLGLLDSRFKNLRPLIKNIQVFIKDKTAELPEEVIIAINALNCFSGLRPLNQEVFSSVINQVERAIGMLFQNNGQSNAGVIIKSALSSVIQSAGNVTVSGQGCVNTNITAGGNVIINGSFKGGEILSEGNVEINELGSNLGVPPVVRVSSGGTVKVRRAYEGSVIQVGNRRITLTKEMESFKARLNKDGQMELY